MGSSVCWNSTTHPQGKKIKNSFSLFFSFFEIINNDIFLFLIQKKALMTSTTCDLGVQLLSSLSIIPCDRLIHPSPNRLLLSILSLLPYLCHTLEKLNQQKLNARTKPRSFFFDFDHFDVFSCAIFSYFFLFFCFLCFYYFFFLFFFFFFCVCVGWAV